MAVEASGAFVVWIDPEMHGPDPMIAKRLELGVDHPSSPAACLNSGKNVDVKMRRVLVLKPGRSAARILDSLQHVGIARSGGRQSGDLVAHGRPPVCREVPVEQAGVGDAYDIADRPITVNENKGKVFGELEIGYRPDVTGQTPVAVKGAGIVTAIGGPQADIKEGFSIRFNRGTDEATGIHHFATSCVALCRLRSREELMH